MTMTKRAQQMLGSAVLAWCTVFFLSSRFLLTVPLLMESSSVLCLPVTAGIAFLYWNAFFPCDKRRFLISYVSGILMGLMYILGLRYSSDQIAAATPLSFITALLAAALLFAAFMSLLLRVVPLGRTVGVDSGAAAPPMSGRRAERRKLLLLFLITAAVHLPAFLAAYPGIYSYDASIQTLQFFGGMPVSNHHPVLHTLFLCGCLKLGEVLFHSYQAGMVLHSLIQVTVMSAVFTFVLSRMIRRNAPRLLVIASWLFLAVNPYMQIFALLTTKDVLFGAFFLLVFDFSIDMVADPEHFFSSRREQAGFFLSALFSCFFRNQGIHVFLFFSLFALFFFLRSRRGLPVLRWFLCTAAVSAVYLVITGPLYTSLGVEKGDPREMFSVPMQQLARVWSETPESLSEEERAYIETLILPEALESYIRVNADPVKSGFQTEVMQADPARFISTWASVGVKEPLVYLDSFLMGNWGYWYPGQTQYWINYILYDGAFMEEPYNVLHIFRNSHFPFYDKCLRRISLTPEYEKLPLAALILNQAFPFWLMLITGAAAIYRRKAKLLIPLTLLFGYWGTLLLGPVVCVRYVYPLILCVPLLSELLLCGAAGRSRCGGGKQTQRTETDTAD